MGELRRAGGDVGVACTLLQAGSGAPGEAAGILGDLVGEEPLKETTGNTSSPAGAALLLLPAPAAAAPALVCSERPSASRRRSRPQPPTVARRLGPAAATAGGCRALGVVRCGGTRRDRGGESQEATGMTVAPATSQTVGAEACRTTGVPGKGAPGVANAAAAEDCRTTPMLAALGVEAVASTGMGGAGAGGDRTQDASCCGLVVAPRGGDAVTCNDPAAPSLLPSGMAHERGEATVAANAVPSLTAGRRLGTVTEGVAPGEMLAVGAIERHVVIEEASTVTAILGELTEPGATQEPSGGAGDPTQEPVGAVVQASRKTKPVEEFAAHEESECCQPAAMTPEGGDAGEAKAAAVEELCCCIWLQLLVLATEWSPKTGVESSRRIGAERDGDSTRCPAPALEGPGGSGAAVCDVFAVPLPLLAST